MAEEQKPGVKLYDFNKKEYVDVPEDQVQPLVLTGNYGFEEGSEISVQTPEGQYEKVDPKNVFKAFQRGYTYEPPSQARARVEKKEFGGRDIEAGLAGAARGLTFGLSDQALTKTGITTPEDLKKLKEYNEAASTVGEVGAIAATALIPGAGQAGLAARGAKAATSGVKAATKAANATEKLVAKALKDKAKGKLAKTIAEKIVPRTAGSMVEGSFYGTGQVISENALGETDLNAENLLAGAGLGALLGGAATGVFSGLGASTAPAVSAASKAVKAGKVKVDDIVNRAKEPLLDTVSFVSGKDKKSLQKFFTDMTPQQRADALAVTNRREVLRDEMTDALAEMREKLTDKKMFNLAKSSNVDEALKTIAPKRVTNNMDDLVLQLDEVAEELRLDQLPLANKFTRKVETLKRKLEDFNPEKETTSDLFNLINTFKRDVGDILPFGKRELTVEEQALLGSGRRAYDYTKDFLENPDVWGEAGVVQSQLNEASTKLQKSSQVFDKYFFNKSKGKIDPGKIKTFLRKADTKEGEDAIEALNDYMVAADSYSTVLDNVSKYAPEIKLNTEAVKSLNKKLSDIRTEGLQKAAQEAELMGLKSREGGELSSILLGSMVDPTAGALAGVYQGFKDPYRALKVLSTVEQSYIKNKQRLNKAVDGFTKKAQGKVKKPSTIRPATTAALINLNYSGEKRGKAKSKDEGFKRVSEDLTQMVQNPQKLADVITERTNVLSSEAPETGTFVAQKASAAVNFLYDKMPKNPAAETSLNPLIRNWKPSATELAKFEKYIAAVENPMSIIEDLEEGRVSPESVEALQAVYPKIYNDIVQTLNNKTAELQLTLPYKQRLQLSTLFGVQLDESMKYTLQYQPTQEEQQEQITQGAAESIDRSEAMESGTQALLTEEY